LSYRQLAWCTTWYLREETLKPAIASIVNRHHRQSLAQLWGGGTENINALHAGDVGLRINPDPFQGDSE
jgi:TnpA family transposase